MLGKRGGSRNHKLDEACWRRTLEETRDTPATLAGPFEANEVTDKMGP